MGLCRRGHFLLGPAHQDTPLKEVPTPVLICYEPVP